MGSSGSLLVGWTLPLFGYSQISMTLMTGMMLIPIIQGDLYLRPGPQQKISSRQLLPGFVRSIHCPHVLRACAGQVACP